MRTILFFIIAAVTTRAATLEIPDIWLSGFALGKHGAAWNFDFQPFPDPPDFFTGRPRQAIVSGALDGESFAYRICRIDSTSFDRHLFSTSTNHAVKLVFSFPKNERAVYSAFCGAEDMHIEDRHGKTLQYDQMIDSLSSASNILVSAEFHYMWGDSNTRMTGISQESLQQLALLPGDPSLREFRTNPIQVVARLPEILNNVILSEAQAHRYRNGPPPTQPKRWDWTSIRTWLRISAFVAGLASASVMIYRILNSRDLRDR